MFIKILTPNHNGKIELTVRDLEALIEEAVEKAIREKCAGCYRNYSTGIAYLNSKDNSNHSSLDSGQGLVTQDQDVGFPSGSVVKNLLANAGDMGSVLIPDLGRSHMPQSD